MPGGVKRGTPTVPDKGPLRLLHIGSVRKVTPSSWTSTVEWRIQVTVAWGRFARGNSGSRFRYVPSCRGPRGNSRRRCESPVPESPLREAGIRAHRARAALSAQRTAARDGRPVPVAAELFTLSGARFAGLDDRIQGHEATDGGRIAEDRDDQRGKEQWVMRWLRLTRLEPEGDHGTQEGATTRIEGTLGPAHYRSEERRVGKECRSRW